MRLALLGAVHDSTLPLPIQSTSVRLLLNLVDHIYHNTEPNPAMGRTLLNYILETLVEKFGTLRRHARPLLKEEGNEEGAFEAEPSTSLASSTSALSSTGAFLGSSSPPPPQASDVKALLKTMLLGLKTVIWCVHNYRTTPIPTAPSASSPHRPRSTHDFTTAERALLSKYVDWGMSCLSVYRSPLLSPDTPHYKEILESFSSSLAVVPPPTLRSILLGLMPTVFKTLLDDPTIMQVIQGLLMNSSVSRAVCEGMMEWLMTKVSKVKHNHRSKAFFLTKPRSFLRSSTRSVRRRLCP